MPERIKIYNGTIISPNGLIPNGTVLVENERIAWVGDHDLQVDNAFCIDAKGQFISPGFIDLHVHGGGGADFMDGTVDAFLKVAQTHLKFGTTAMVPTTLTSDTQSLIAILELYEQAVIANKTGAQFLGMHLEGPYFAMNQRGAQDPQYIRNPNPEEYEPIIDRFTCIKRWSAAPELEGALAFGKYLRSKNVLVALAHTDAIYEEVLPAFEIGYNLATHLYSGMSGVSRRNCFRYAGVIESSLLIDGMDVEVIADGIHLPEALLKLIYKIKGADRIALITDAMRGAAMPEGESILGSQHTGIKVIIEDGVAKLPNRTAFAGSVATANRLVRNMVQMAGISLIDAVKMITATPARIMGVDHKKGTIASGMDADIVIFDNNIDIDQVIVMGKISYAKSRN